MTDLDELLQQQVAYYRARASEYDAAYTRRIGFDVLATELSALDLTGDVLELACGTGQWTKVLAGRARTVTALDAAPEMLAIARQRIGDPRVSFIQADIFDWEPRRTYDAVFFAFWLTHVPSIHFEGFWAKVHQAVATEGRVIFVDDGPRKAELEEFVPLSCSEAVLRRLSDGNTYRAVKVLYEPRDLESRLTNLGWRVKVAQAGLYHLIAVAAPGTRSVERNGWPGPDGSGPTRSTERAAPFQASRGSLEAVEPGMEG